MSIVPLLLYAALQAPAPSPAAPAEPKGTAKVAEPEKSEPPTKGLRRSLRATLVAIDAEQMTVRFTDEKGQQKTWPVDRTLAAASPRRAQALAKAFQPGDPIYVAYHEDEGQPTITELARRTAADDAMDRRDSRQENP
jgi:hypothetical protein